jgi:hypothetical protein
VLEIVGQKPAARGGGAVRISTGLTAKDIIEHFLKYKELRELEERIEAIEQRLEGHGR